MLLDCCRSTFGIRCLLVLYSKLTLSNMSRAIYFKVQLKQAMQALICYLVINN